MEIDPLLEKSEVDWIPTVADVWPVKLALPVQIQVCNGYHHHEVFPPSFSRKLEDQDSDRKNKRQLNLVVFSLLHQPRQHSIIGTCT